MNKFDQTRKLRGHYLFAPLSVAQWEQLTPHVTLLELPAHARLFLKDDPARLFYVVLDGAVKLYRISSQGHETIMRLVQSGQSFAESVLFSDQPQYPVSALALEASRVASIGRDAYLALLRESFETCRAVMAEMTTRIRSHWDEIEGLSLQGSQARVAHYLLNLQARTGESSIQLPSRKGVIATRLGLAPETFSRALRALIDQDFIEVEGSIIELKNSAALEHLAVF